MLERITARDGVVFYRSAQLARSGVPHGFSTRIGGVSAGPFDALNLGNPNGCPIQDDIANIAANYARLHGAIAAADRRRYFVHQVHSDQVELATPGQPFDCNRKADAIVSTDPAAVAAVRTADCVPVLLATSDGRAVAAIHAGWRGVVAGVAVRALKRLREAWSQASPVGAAMPPVAAAIGPSISWSAFEVGPEVAAEFEQVFNGDAATLLRPSQHVGKAMVDLRAALEIQLRGGGVEAIDCSDRCTFADAGEFFSHRRENGVTGRMAALVGTAG